MDFNKEKQPKILNYKVQFFFGENISTEEQSERIARALEIFEQKGITEIKQSEKILNETKLDRTTRIIRVVVLEAKVPENIALIHHDFDSRFNKPFAFGGCGAGYVSAEEVK